MRDSITGSAGITIFGQDDITGRTTGDAKKREAFKNELCREREGFTLLLKHQPRVDEQAGLTAALGHTIAARFLFSLIVKLYFPKIYGLHRLTSGGLYISVGNWHRGRRSRFRTTEITVIDLKEKQVKM